MATTLMQYNFEHVNRGRCIIINNHHFDEFLTGQMDRDGTDVDADNMEKAFMMLGFEVVRYNDLNVTEMSMTLHETAREDFSEADCFACVILSHGNEGVVYGTNGTIKLESLISSFKGDVCPSLAGKPKLFFIQACRGRRYDFGVDVDTTDAMNAVAIPSNIRKIPVEADILIAYSVVPGHYSWRNNQDGSWFIQALGRVVREHGEELELQHIMTLVNSIVANEFESCTDDNFTSGMKQVPCVVSTLTKLVYFRPK